MASVPPAVISDAGYKHLRLQLTTDVGPVRFHKLLAHFGSVDAILGASVKRLESVDGVGPGTAESILRARDTDQANREVERATALGLRILCAEDRGYPPPLRHIPDPPICLYVRGEFQETDSVAVAIVGTRRCSTYGREQAIRFGELLGQAGFTVISGLARGIDGYAHRGAMQGGGRTIAVLGNGLSEIYPREHAPLADEITGRGAILSEYPIESAPEARNFPRRNRIIAGLALGVIVVEAGPRSGAQITARLATEYNREVFALPGRVDQPAHAAGTNRLIRDGEAKLITCLEDVLDELADVGDIMRPGDGATPDASHAGSIVTPALSDAENAVYRALRDGADDVDDLCVSTQLDPGRVNAVLTSLQIKGLVTQLPGHRFAARTQRRSH